MSGMFFVGGQVHGIDVCNWNSLHVSRSMAIKNRNNCNAWSKLPYENQNQLQNVYNYSLLWWSWKKVEGICWGWCDLFNWQKLVCQYEQYVKIPSSCSSLVRLLRIKNRWRVKVWRRQWWQHIMINIVEEFSSDELMHIFGCARKRNGKIHLHSRERQGIVDNVTFVIAVRRCDSLKTLMQHIWPTWSIMIEQANADCVHQKKILHGVIVVKDIIIVDVMCALAIWHCFSPLQYALIFSAKRMKNEGCCRFAWSCQSDYICQKWNNLLWPRLFGIVMLIVWKLIVLFLKCGMTDWF